MTFHAILVVGTIVGNAQYCAHSLEKDIGHDGIAQSVIDPFCANSNPKQKHFANSLLFIANI